MPGVKPSSTPAAQKRPPPQLDSEDSDDDAPEEFTQAQARDQALQQQKQEQQQRDGQRRAQRQQRRERQQARDASTAAAAANKQDADDDERDTSDDEEGLSSDIEGDDDVDGEVVSNESDGAEGSSDYGEDGDDEEGDADEEEEDDDEEEVLAAGFSGFDQDNIGAEDLLPESVLAAVAARDAEAQQAAAAADVTVALGNRAQRRAAKRQRLQSVKQSVVAVAVLPKLAAAPAPATNFFKESLYGTRIRRSVDMLSKGRNRPAAKFA